MRWGSYEEIGVFEHSRARGTAAGGSKAGPKANEDGFTLIDALIGSVILMIIVVPVSALLITTSKVSANAAYRTESMALAQKMVAQWVLSAEGSANGPPASLPMASATHPQWPTSFGASTFVGSERYFIWAQGGWCTQATSIGSGTVWGDSTTTTSSAGQPASPLAFIVAVKVTWGNAQNPLHVFTAAPVVIPASWPLPQVPDCPLLPGGGGLS